MPDLSLQASHEFWRDYQDPTIYRVVSFLDSVEHWTLDGDPDVEKALVELGNRLDQTTEFELKNEDTYLNICNFLHSSRVLRLLQAIDSSHPGAASRVIMHAETARKSDGDAASLFLRRNMVFERLRLVSRIFSEERFAILTKALEKNYEA
jgi:intracellular multiplication protein IcmW